MTTRSEARTLNQTLTDLGYTTKPAGAAWNQYDMHILKGNDIVFTGDSIAVWDWLRKTKQIT